MILIIIQTSVNRVDTSTHQTGVGAMNSQEVKDLNRYIGEDDYVVTYIGYNDEGYEVTSMDNKFTELANWEPYQLTKDINPKNIIVYRVVHNWRMGV